MHGKGIFAKRDIQKGEIVFLVKGRKIKFLIDSEKQAKIAGLNWVGMGKNEWIDPTKYCVYFNHSCNPNSEIKGKVTVLALRNIKKGEEVTFDYSLSEADIFWHIRCHCNNKNCRKIIRSIQFLPRKIFNQDISSIPKYFQYIYKKFNASSFSNKQELQKKWIGFIEKGFNV